MVTLDDGRQRFRGYLQKFREAMRLSRTDMDRYFASELGLQSSRAIANNMHDRIVHHLRILFDDDPRVRIVMRRGLWVMFVGDDSAFKMKKLNKNLRSSNIKTLQTTSFDNQRPMFEGMPAEVDHFVLGYQLDKFTADITGIYITYPNNGSVQWCMPLHDDHDEDTGITEFPSRPQEPAKPRISRKVERESDDGRGKEASSS